MLRHEKQMRIRIKQKSNRSHKGIRNKKITDGNVIKGNSKYSRKCILKFR